MKRPVVCQQQSFLSESAVQPALPIITERPAMNHRALLAEAEVEIAAAYTDRAPLVLSFDIQAREGA